MNIVNNVQVHGACIYTNDDKISIDFKKMFMCMIFILYLYFSLSRIFKKCRMKTKAPLFYFSQLYIWHNFILSLCLSLSLSLPLSFSFLSLSFSLYLSFSPSLPFIFLFSVPLSLPLLLSLYLFLFCPSLFPLLICFLLLNASSPLPLFLKSMTERFQPFEKCDPFFMKSVGRAKYIFSSSRVSSH